jgi:hypothetical protein
MIASFNFSFGIVSVLGLAIRGIVGLTDNIHDDAREQLALLVLVRTFLETRSDTRAAQNDHLMPSYHCYDVVVLPLIVRVWVVWRGG